MILEKKLFQYCNPYFHPKHNQFSMRNKIHLEQSDPFNVKK